MDFFLVLKNGDVFDSLYTTQIAADRAASGESDLTAHQGAVKVPAGAVGDGSWKLDKGKLVSVEMLRTDAAEAALLLENVKSMLLEFDAGLHFHWATQKSVSGELPSAVLANAERTKRYDNTDLWGRSWIGMAWREGDRLANGHADKRSLAHVRSIAAQCQAEIVDANHIGFWYAYHFVDQWALWLNPEDATSNRIFYATTASGNGSIFTDPLLSVTTAEWTDIITTQYENAFKAAVAGR